MEIYGTLWAPTSPSPPEKGASMDKWQCLLCGYVYDPEEGDPTQGISPGTAFEDLPDDWECPDCGASKDEFEKMAD
jgi:rubredoxin